MNKQWIFANCWSRDISDIKKLENPRKKVILVFYSSIIILKLKYFPEKTEKIDILRYEKGIKYLSRNLFQLFYVSPIP